MSEHGGIEHIPDKRIALLIAVLALCLALVETGAKSTQTQALSSNVEASNLWAFFQARTVRQTTLRTALEESEFQKPGIADPAVRTALEAQQKKWRDTIAAWEDDPAKGEGRKQLSAHAKEAEEVARESLAKYHLYEYSAAAFQVAIVVVSASVVTGVALLGIGGVLVALAGVVLGVLGYAAPHLVHF